MTELKLALIATLDILFSFNKLITECLLRARFYTGLDIKRKDHTAIIKELKVSWGW